MDQPTQPTVLPKSSRPKISLFKVRIVILVFIFSILSFVGGYLFGAEGFTAEADQLPNVNISRDLPETQQDLDFELFWQVWDTLETSYFDSTKLDSSEMVYGAIKGMVAAVGDPYTVFLTPRENKVTEEDLSGNFEGIGIQIGFRGSQLAVIAPLTGSPAEEVGIQAGDIIAGIKDENKDIERGTVGITLPEAVEIIRGEAGTTIKLSLLREGNDQPIIVDVVRKQIDVPSIVLTYVGEDESIAHLQVMKFGGETFEEWNESILDILKKQNLRGIVLDVRNNPGGYLQGAIDLGSDFLEEGEVVVVEENASGTRDEYLVERIGRLTKDNVVVLINGGSASASEILAGSLRDNNKVQLVGETSFGKGTIQDAKRLENETGLHITIAKWLTPSGYWVNEQGLVPDVEVEDNPETPEDEQLLEAISLITSGNTTAQAR